MVDERIEIALKQCEENGLAWAKVFIEGQENSHYGLAVRYWIARREREEQDVREERQRQLSEAAVTAAKRSADVSRQAAIASGKAAFWTMVAAISAAAGTIFQAGIAFAQYKGWIPKS